MGIYPLLKEQLYTIAESNKIPLKNNVLIFTVMLKINSVENNWWLIKG